MASDLSRDQLHRLARLGAARRLEELRQEIASIRAAFPGVESGDRTERGTQGRSGTRTSKRSASGSSKRPAAQDGASPPSPASVKAKRRYKMSAAQKRAVSDRMKKYWAARRKAKG